MSNFLNDTLQSQIERGEVFFDLLNFYINAGGIFYYYISVGGTANVSLRVGLGSLSQTDLTVYTGPNDGESTGLSRTPVNMNFSDTTTILDISAEAQVSPTVFGTPKPSEAFQEGVPRTASPYTTESGVILTSSTENLIKVQNNGPIKSLYQLGLFFRSVS